MAHGGHATVTFGQVPPATDRGFEGCSFFWCQPQPGNQQRHGIAMRRTVNAALKRADGACAQPGALGQLFLSESGSAPVASQQIREGQGACSAHGCWFPRVSPATALRGQRINPRNLALANIAVNEEGNTCVVTGYPVERRYDSLKPHTAPDAARRKPVCT